MTAPVTAVVLGSRGGNRLRRALASVAWARERVVLDPANRLAGESLPAGVARTADASAVTSAPWILVLEESEVVTPELGALVAAATERTAPAAYRIPIEMHALGVALRPVGAPMRLARRHGVRLRIGMSLALEIPPDERGVGRLREPIVCTGADSLAGALDDLDADAGALAGVLHAAGASPALRHLVVTPLLSSARTLAARGAAGPLWRRWALAVFAGYRAAVAQAKLWEFRRAEAGRPS